MKKFLSLFVVIISLAIFFFPTTSNSNAAGSVGGKTGSPMDNSDCSSCHSLQATTSGNTTNITSNIPNTGYIAGNTYTITANLGALGGPLGFEITCEENTTGTKTGTIFITNSSETQLVNNGNAITHTTAGNSSNQWSFDWEAPSIGTGDVTFYGAFIQAGYPIGANIGDYLTLSTLDISEAQTTCNLTDASVYIDHDSSQWIMNANGGDSISLYDYSWIDTNGLVISTTSQTPFYTQWCVTITDNTTGCDTTICQNCIADSTVICGCIMIYMPVCGCDGVQYANSCIADCADVSWTPAISNGMPGGFLPCNQPNTCEVEIFGDSTICNATDTIMLIASPTTISTSFVSYVWSNMLTGDTIFIDSPGVYSVTATDSTGCASTASFSVFIEGITIYSNPSIPLICLGDTISLEFSNTPLTDIVWVPTGDTTHMIYDAPGTSTMYIVEGIDINGCDRIGEIFVDVDSCNNIYGCTDSTACNWGPSANIDDGSCILPDGCTDSLACNYDYTALCDNGTCFGIVGCMDALYLEYNANATCDPNNDQCITLISTTIYEKELALLIYPNPAAEEFFINLNSFNYYNIEINDTEGRRMIKMENVNNFITINTSKFSEGTYFIKIQTHLDIQTHKIVIDR